MRHLREAHRLYIPMDANWGLGSPAAIDDPSSRIGTATCSPAGSTGSGWERRLPCSRKLDLLASRVVPVDPDRFNEHGATGAISRTPPIRPHNRR
jgi:hypothetical protein